MAGAEAAWQAARAGIRVVVHEMRPVRRTDAHETDQLAELVCSNSFRSDDALANAVGILHREMRAMGSLVMACADANQVPAGGALAVDREGFAAAVTRAIAGEPLIELRREEIAVIPPDWDNVIVATGPLTSPALAEAIRAKTGIDALAFFDAIAPIVHRETIDMDVAWFQSRYDKVGPGGTGADYINCPLTRDGYDAFVDALLAAPKTEFRDFEVTNDTGSANDAGSAHKTPYFDGCLPIEVMAARGRETLRHGPMKPFGLTDPRRADKPYAVVQLRQDNALGTLYNIVGFQTKLKHSAQTQVFRTIPGLQRAEFARLGGIHRNTFLNSPSVLDGKLRLRADPRLRFAGQITGCEGYVESAAVGLIAGRCAAAQAQNGALALPPETTAIGALLNHITGGHIATIDAGPPSFQPINVNFGLFPPLEAAVKADDGKRLRGPEKAKARKLALSERADRDLRAWLDDGSQRRAVAAQ